MKVNIARVVFKYLLLDEGLLLPFLQAIFFVIKNAFCPCVPM